MTVTFMINHRRAAVNTETLAAADNRKLQNNNINQM